MSNVEFGELPPEALKEAREMEQQKSEKEKLELLPKTEVVDQNGLTQEFFEFNLPQARVRVLFRDREALPDPNLLADQKTILIGALPYYRNPERIKEWYQQVDQKSQGRILKLHRRSQYDWDRKRGGMTYEQAGIRPNNLYNPAEVLKESQESQGITLVVNPDTEDIIVAADFLMSLRGDTRETRQQALNEAKESIEYLTDLAIAGDICDQDGNFDLEHQSHDGKAAVLASLFGDKKVLTAYQERLNRYIENLAPNFQESRRLDIEGLDPEHKEFLNRLHVVRSTNHPPIEDPKTGKWHLPSRVQFSEGTEGRPTIHFSLNHKVAPHMFGNWSGNRYLVITPLRDMLELHGLPENLNAADTFWQTSPNQIGFELPSTTVVVEQHGVLPNAKDLGDKIFEPRISAQLHNIQELREEWSRVQAIKEAKKTFSYPEDQKRAERWDKINTDYGPWWDKEGFKELVEELRSKYEEEFDMKSFAAYHLPEPPWDPSKSTAENVENDRHWRRKYDRWKKEGIRWREECRREKALPILAGKPGKTRGITRLDDRLPIDWTIRKIFRELKIDFLPAGKEGWVVNSENEGKLWLLAKTLSQLSGQRVANNLHIGTIGHKFETADADYAILPLRDEGSQEQVSSEETFEQKYLAGKKRITDFIFKDISENPSPNNITFLRTMYVRGYI